MKHLSRVAATVSRCWLTFFFHSVFFFGSHNDRLYFPTCNKLRNQKRATCMPIVLCKCYCDHILFFHSIDQRNIVESYVQTKRKLETLNGALNTFGWLPAVQHTENYRKYSILCFPLQWGTFSTERLQRPHTKAPPSLPCSMHATIFCKSISTRKTTKSTYSRNNCKLWLSNMVFGSGQNSSRTINCFSSQNIISFLRQGYMPQFKV